MRKKEFLKRSEARIIVFLNTVANSKKTGSWISDTLHIDYIYIMRLLRGMYQLGWIKSHRYQERDYFEITEAAPLKIAKKIITEEQDKLKA